MGWQAVNVDVARLIARDLDRWNAWQQLLGRMADDASPRGR
jgi:hypothetical protein